MIPSLLINVALKRTKKNKLLLKAMYVDQPLIQVNKDFLTEWREQRLLNVKGATIRREFILLSAFSRGALRSSDGYR